MLQRLFSVLDFVKAGLVNAGLVNQNLANGQFFRYGSAVVIVLALVGCQSAPTQSGRYTQQQDSAPKHVAKKPETLDAVPKYEAYRMFNSRPYKVLGKHYTPMDSGKGYEEVGYASGQYFAKAMLAAATYADLVLVEAETVTHAVVSHPPRRLVLKAGRIVARDGKALQEAP